MDGAESEASGSEASDEAIESLVFSFLERCEAPGARPTEVLESLCEAHPDAEARLRAAVESISGSGLTRADATPEPLQRVVGGYRLLERLGAGGMGVVFRARPESGGADVALKLLHPQIQSEPEVRERFAREASAIERLDHPAIVRVHEHGEVREGGVSTPFLAMALHGGIALDRAVEALGRTEVTSSDGAELGAALHSAIDPEVDPLARSSRFRGPWWKVVARIGADLASALAHAHECGVTHRDVKPSNVLAAPDGRVLLLDFGLAVTSDSGRLTRTGAQLGSLPYMAPEQVAGRTTDVRVDVYGLGLVLHELLTLRPAFAAGAPDALAVAIQRGVSLRPSRVVSWIPTEVAASVDAIVERATQRDPADRYATARDLADDLRALEAGEPLSIQPISGATRFARTVRRYPLQFAIAALVLGFLAIGTAVRSGYERRIDEDRQRDVAAEIATIADRVESLKSGPIGLSQDPLGDSPMFAPTALPRMLDERRRLERSRARLRELAADGEDVAGLSMQTDVLLADVLIAIANARSSLGRHEEAISGYRAHAEQLEQMIEAPAVPGGPTRQWLRAELGRSSSMLARAVHLATPLDVPLEEAVRGTRLIEEARDADLDWAVSSSQLVAALMIEAEARKRAGDAAGASAALDRAESISLDAFGEDPRELRFRAHRGEIEMRRVAYGFETLTREERIGAFRRAIEWFEGGLEDIDSQATYAVLRMDAGRRLAEELRRDRRFEEAEECLTEMIERGRRLV
ncbi:MAG: serine/threonine-protein kinase, partial [Planctomycetota bacterium]